MGVTKESLSDIRERYEKAHKKIDEDSRHDPPTEPFRSHYEARDILQSVQRNLKNLSESLNEESDTALTVRCILANVLKDIGKISIFTEELSNGELILKEALELVQKDEEKSQVVNAYVEVLNQLGILYCTRSSFEESKKFLEQAGQVYENAKRDELEALTIYDLFGTKDEIEKGKGMVLLEKNHTLTLYYLAQVYGYLENLEKSAHFCHLTLKRQLDYKDFEHIDWALNAATLSQYYFPRNCLSQARHLLAAASYMLDRYEEEVIANETSAAIKADMVETHSHRSADVARCWAKYAIHILATSKERLSRDDEDEDGKPRPAADLSPNREINRFIGLEALSVYEDQITAEFCLTIDDAKLVMLKGLSWLNKAKEYYTKETEASQYAKIVQDIASLYKHLAFFDDDEDNQCKLYKRCADQLEDLSQVLNATYYQAICREIWYELGLTYSKILDIKLSKLETLAPNERPTPHALNKINKLCEKSIAKFQTFLESYKVPLDTLEIPAAIENAELQAVFFAYFHIGRLYYKIITPDKRLQLANTKNSFRFYHNFVKHCQSNETVGAHFKAEMGVCKEMTKLLPLKIKKLMNELDE
ncbi:KIF-binding protein [Toxorhynchites rutilus septentrionalis]|uniref:KIF-binding protein n=1 Tax=Toxorhynchites rutilus septentrionalis TaxID=329112 RepID=UPI00247B0AEF|nr:KIF-binding protein [Toxorhynchites rutilus septentrionalis]XP_055638887.1 KIF-binding protein [Toxorhynchites rutilus septentrionalis]